MSYVTVCAFRFQDFANSLSIIPTSAISMTVKSTRKIKNVVCTEPTSSLEMAALVGSISWMAHG